MLKIIKKDITSDFAIILIFNEHNKCAIEEHFDCRLKPNAKEVLLKGA